VIPLACASAAQAGTASPELGFDGYGSYRWGLGMKQALADRSLACEQPPVTARDGRGQGSTGNTASCATSCATLERPDVTFAFYERSQLAAILTADKTVKTNRGIGVGATTTQVRRAYPGATTHRTVSYGIVVQRLIAARFKGHALTFHFNTKSRIEFIIAYANDWRAIRYSNFC
jgi:hypothetical protein